MSQVKNLLAMFEQKGDSSPPDRGRGQSLPPQSDSPRPLSRVRTTFITVEKDGRVGLQRDPSADSAHLLTRKTSNGADNGAVLPALAPQQVVPSKQTGPPPSPEEATPRTREKTPATPAPNPAPMATPKRPYAAQLKALPPTPTRDQDDKEPGLAADSVTIVEAKTVGKNVTKVKDVVKDVTTLVASEAPQAEAREVTESQPPLEDFKKPVEAPVSESEAKLSSAHADADLSNRPPTTANGTAKVTSSGTTSPSGIPVRSKATCSAVSGQHKAAKGPSGTGKHVPKSISTSKTVVKVAPKTPTLKTPTSLTKLLTPKVLASAKAPETKAHIAAEMAVARGTMPESMVLSTTTSRSTAPSSTKKPPAIQTFPSNGIGFVKPKPKSPTRPLQLPASLTTHTAASATKINTQRQSLSRLSDNYSLTYQSITRSPSRASISTAGTTITTAAQSLRRQNSTINRSRPSLGPPPKKLAQDHPVVMKEREIDEGFLARMMRPTQASASKSADKVHNNPPKKGAVTTTKRPASQLPKRLVEAPSGRKSAIPKKASTASLRKANGAAAVTGHKENASIVKETVANAIRPDGVADLKEPAPGPVAQDAAALKVTLAVDDVAAREGVLDGVLDDIQESAEVSGIVPEKVEALAQQEMDKEWELSTPAAVKT